MDTLELATLRRSVARQDEAIGTLRDALQDALAEVELHKQRAAMAERSAALAWSLASWGGARRRVTAEMTART